MGLTDIHYKETEIGIIPSDWELKNLSQVAMLEGGFAFSSKKFAANGEFQIIRMGNLYQGNLDLSRSSAFLSYLNPNEEHFLLKENDILITLTGTVGKKDYGFTYRIKKEQKLLLNQRVARLVVKENINPIYIDCQFKTDKILNQFFELAKGGTGNQANVGVKDIESIKIPIPQPNEQTAIATALSDIDALIENLEKLIEKKQNIKQGMMQELLTGRKRLTGFNGKLVEKKLGEVAEVLKGRGLSKKRLHPEGEKPCILYGELFTSYNRIIYNVKSKTNIDEGELSKAGDILMPGSTTTIGIDLAIASTILQNNVLLGGDINIIRPSNKYIDSIFLSYYLTEVMKYKISELTQGITIIHLYGKDLRTLIIALPPIEEQSSIANIFKEIDTEIEMLQQKMTKYRMIKQGMMQVLLTGKIRLNH